MPPAVAPPTPGPALWEAVAGLALRVDDVALDILERETPAFTRRTTVVRLRADGREGVGEDVTYDPEAHPALLAWDGLPDLRGEWTIASFSAALDGVSLFPSVPVHAVDERYRRWAFESAALDLALRQAGLAWDAALGRTVRPLTFVSSRGVGDPPDPATVEDLRRRSPGLGMKLDLGLAWDASSARALQATGAVRIVDLKGLYRGTPVDTPVDAAVYAMLLEALPDALFEDPGVTDETRGVLAPHEARLTWDVPLHDVADLDALPFAPRIVNLKPSRIGSIRELSALYEACRARGIGAYSGGQTELGPGRGQAQLLAATFHPDGPNDLAPTVFNDVELPADLPAYPLPLRPAPTGFRLAAGG
ncbi:hypothetical protein [Patulibacter americanus]|uniref:hypothetical protein n=1 Tax=Patulibacter americanus TaxID=588672 RepID=UPI0003B3BC16|nr:hypothetical protein [Patulibacter americanus]